MLRKHVLRFGMLAILSLATWTPAYAGDCEAYCQGYADGFCAAQQPPQEADYQGCETDPEGGYDCYFGCIPPP